MKVYHLLVCIPSKIFHSTFYENYKESYPRLSLFENCCQVNFENFMQHMEDDYGDKELMDEKIKEF